MGIEFESKVGQYQAAKKLFYRAMAQIGACKGRSGDAVCDLTM